MDAVIENVKNSFEVRVKKTLIAGPQKKALMTNSSKEKNKLVTKIFGGSLCEICQRECNTVPYIIKDTCSFIQKNHLDLEGIFRISASSVQTTKLRRAFEEHSFDDKSPTSVCSISNVDGHTAANVLKQFLRQLAEPLIPEEVLKISQETNCVSDEAFAGKVRSIMSSWATPHRDTLQYLLTFLKPIMRNMENRMNLTGLAVVFGPNLFRIPSGIGGLEVQTLANRTLERLLLTSDVICNVKDDQGYLNMTSSPPSPCPKAVRSAPAIPLQARPLPPPPVPAHAPCGDVIIPTLTSSPSIPVRSKSLSYSLESTDSFDSNLITSGSYSGKSDAENVTHDLMEKSQILHNNSDVIEEAISHVVRKHLFTADSSSCSSCVEDNVTPWSHDHDVMVTSLLPSLTWSRNKGPKRRKPTRRYRSCNMEEAIPPEGLILPIPMPRKSHNGDAASDSESTFMQKEDAPLNSDLSPPPELPQPSPMQSYDSAHQVESTETQPFRPDLAIDDVFDNEKGAVDSVTEVVPPLDLSGMTSSDEVRPKPLPRRESPSRVKRRKRKRSKASPDQTRTSLTPPSDPISIPTPTSEGDAPRELSPPDGNLKWRDAWSTDEESVPMKVAMENALKRNGRCLNEKDENIELAPSSPENHVVKVHSSFPHRRLHRRHHHHSNRLSKGYSDAGSPPPKDEKDCSHLLVSVEKIERALEESRRTAERPEDLTRMTREEIRSEKLAMQRELLKHEEKYGRPFKKAEKDVMRGVYERYRMVKRLLVDSLAPPFHNPHIRRIDDVDRENYEVDIEQTMDDFAVTQTLPISTFESEKMEQFVPEGAPEASISIGADLSLSELKKQQREAKGQRKRLRRKLKEFEKEIEQQYGRTVTQADKVVMVTEYQEQKALKAKIRLLDALIEKHVTQIR